MPTAKDQTPPPPPHVALLREAGHSQLAEDINQRIVGRNVISGRWTFHVVEDYDDGYYAGPMAVPTTKRCPGM